MARWMVNDRSDLTGPFDEEQVVRLIETGLHDGAFVRREEEPNWKGLRDHPAFALALANRIPLANQAPPWRGAAVGFSVVILLAMLGVAVYKLGDRVGDCVPYLEQASAALRNENWDESRVAVAQAKAFCGSRHADELAFLEQKVRLHDEKEAQAIAVKKAEEATNNERQAVVSFPGEVAQIRVNLKEAAALVAKKDLEHAAPRIKSVQVWLQNYKGTSVEKSDDWRALDAQASDLWAKVQPYVQQVNRDLDAARRQLAADAEEERRAGVMKTKGGYFAASTLEKIQKVTKYVAAKDREGIRLLVENDPDIITLEPGLRVVIFERGGILSGYVHVRVRGTLTEFWTYSEAVEKP